MAQRESVYMGENKLGLEHLEKGAGAEQIEHGDHALKTVADDRVELTQEDDDRIRRKTDKRILVMLCWLYFLQILDKSVLGYGNVFGLSTDTGLVGNQYSLVSTMNAIAQLAWQPFSSYLIVRVPARHLMTFMVFAWGTAQACMAVSTNFHALVATRFLLGLFEACCLPVFSILTAQWYRRSEQPLRVAAWYSMNGTATIFAALFSFGLGHITSGPLASWQIIFLFVGLITVVSAPLCWFFLDSDIPSARFLDETEKAQAIERLKANQTGTGSNEFKWAQIWEMFYDPKSFLWMAMALCLNVGASVSNAYGPTLIKGLGFDIYVTALLNMPFGLLQFVCILAASYAVQKWKFKSGVLAVFVVPVIVGLVVLYTQGTASSHKQGAQLVGYYMLAFLFGGNPLIVSWMVANTAGQTKKSAVISLYQAASSVGECRVSLPILPAALPSDPPNPYLVHPVPLAEADHRQHRRPDALRLQGQAILPPGPAGRHGPLRWSSRYRRRAGALPDVAQQSPRVAACGRGQAGQDRRHVHEQHVRRCRCVVGSECPARLDRLQERRIRVCVLRVAAVSPNRGKVDYVV